MKGLSTSKRTFLRTLRKLTPRTFSLKNLKTRESQISFFQYKTLVSYNCITTIMIYNFHWANLTFKSLITWNTALGHVEFNVWSEAHVMGSWCDGFSQSRLPPFLHKNVECGNVNYSFRYIQLLRYSPLSLHCQNLFRKILNRVKNVKNT